MEPTYALSLQRLPAELQDIIDCDEQFIARGEEILRRWKLTARRMEKQLRKILEAKTSAGPNSNSI